MKDCCEISYNKNYTNATKCCKISDVTQIFDAAKFAKWLTDAFNESSYKSWEQVAKEVGSTRSTLSRYAGAKQQQLTGKPSQPKPDLVINLANLFGKNVDEALLLAGHAPKDKGAVIEAEIDKGVYIQFQHIEKFTETELKEIINDFVMVYQIAKQRLAARRENQEGVS